MTKETESHGTNGAKPKTNGMSHKHVRSTDSLNHIFRVRYEKALNYSIKVIAIAIGIGIAYANINHRLERVECNMKMLVDVVVFKKDPRQPDC